MPFTPREYQKQALDKIYSDLQAKQNVLLQAIMGAGKTFMCVRLIQRLAAENPDMNFLILMHKQELCLQFFESFQKFTTIPFIDIGICCAGIGEKIINNRITIASIQTFINVMEKYSGAGLIIIDECHKIDINGNSQYKKTIDYLRLQRPNCRILGTSATPARLGHGYIYGNKCKPGNINLFDECSCQITYEQLKKEGHLVPLKGVVANHESLEFDLSGVATSGDYVIDQLGEIMCKEIHLETAVEAIQKYCGGYKRICVFCCTIDHAEKLHALIGSESTIVHSRLSDIERSINMNDWKSGKKRIMTSVNILTEGFDMPILDCLVFARPTLSSSLWLQAVGRVLRPSPGKDHGFIVDLTDNTARFGNDIDRVKVTIPKAVEDAIKKERSIWKICPNCDIEVHVALRECPDCHFQWPETECIVAQALPDMKSIVFEKSPPVWYDVINYNILIHTSKQNGNKLGKIDFFFEQSNYKRSRVSMFLCFPDYYAGYAVTKSEEKWDKISNDEFPESVDDFLRKSLHMPEKILVDISIKYPELVDIEVNKNLNEDDEKDIAIDIEIPVSNIDVYDDDLPF